jgi:hypothetical protein
LHEATFLTSERGSCCLFVYFDAKGFAVPTKPTKNCAAFSRWKRIRLRAFPGGQKNGSLGADEAAGSLRAQNFPADSNG